MNQGFQEKEDIKSSRYTTIFSSKHLHVQGNHTKFRISCEKNSTNQEIFIDNRQQNPSNMRNYATIDHHTRAARARAVTLLIDNTYMRKTTRQYILQQVLYTPVVPRFENLTRIIALRAVNQTTIHRNAK